MDVEAEGTGTVPPARPTQTNEHPTRMKRTRLLVGASVLLAIGGVTAWQVIAHRGLESTDNANIAADTVPVPARVGGVVAQVLFVDNQRVTEGQPLAVLDGSMARARVAQAEAMVAAAEAQAQAAAADVVVAATNAASNNDLAIASRATAGSAVTGTRAQLREGEATVQSARAGLAKAAADRDRSQALLKEGAIPQSDHEAASTAYTVAASTLDAARAHLAILRAGIAQAEDRIGEADARLAQARDVGSLVAQAQARADAATAQIAVARAALASSTLEQSYGQILSPQAGVLSKKTVAVGQMLGPGQAIAQLVTEGRWVEANFKETQIADMRVGQPAKIYVDAFPDATLEAHVASFSDGTGALFALLPPDNASGNFTKVVQRVPVRLELEALPDGIALRPGLSVTVVVDTRGGGASVAN